MKRKLFNNPSTLVMSILFLVFLTISCTKKTTELVQPSEEFVTAKGGGGSPNSLSIVSLRVTINDAAGNNITSDNQGEYVNGIDYVQAIIDQYGTFAFNTFSPSQKIRNAVVKRWVNYNFNNPVDPGNTYRPSPEQSQNYHFSTGGSSFGTNPFIPLQNLGVNGNPTSECIYMGNGIYNSATAWRVSFHKGQEDVANSPTAFAVVTRTSISPAEWTITPIGGSCTSNSNVASLRNDATSELYGYYYIPFFFTLKAQ